MIKISLIFFFFIQILSYEKTSFKLYIKGIPNKISVKSRDIDCINCIFYRLKIKDDENITMSIPRLYNSSGSIIYGTDVTTLVSWKKDFSTLSVWPDLKIMYPYDQWTPYKLYSVIGFTIDNDDKYYLLDQGKIIYENNTVEINTSKVVVVGKNGREKDIIYNFNGEEYTNSLLIDITVDHEGKYIYVVDSGNLLNNRSQPGIIVINTDTKSITKVLHNHTSFKSNENNLSDNSNINPKDYFSKSIGVNTIQISCNDETLYYSSQKSKNIYSVSTKNIIKAIKLYEEDKDINILKNIEVNTANQNFLNQDFVLSSKNNVFMINNQSKNVEVSFYLDNDLSHFNYKINSKINCSQATNPSSIDITNGNIYLLEYDTDENNENKYNIYKAELEKDELGNNIGCTVFIFKAYGAVIFLFVWFFIILCVTVLLIIVNGWNKIENSNIQREREKEEEINELNRQLNEGNDNNK